MMVNKYLNINSRLQHSLFNPDSRKIISHTELYKILPPSIAEIELSKQKQIPIPDPVSHLYKKYRPTPLFRAREFEKAIKTDCKIYVKDEGVSPSLNHKINSAYLIAYFSKKDGIKTLTTETTGNWGIALAIAGKEFGIKIKCFMDKNSADTWPKKIAAMKQFGADVEIVDLDEDHGDLISLSADRAITVTRKMNNARYIFGSVFNYFLIPQSIIGLEAKHQLNIEGKYPDIVVGSCGGGANLLGLSSAFIEDRLDMGKNTEFFSVESENCPILSMGKKGLYSIDSQSFFPLINTYGLPGLLNAEYIGGLGSTIVSSAVAHFHSEGIIKAKAFTLAEANHASDIFYKTEKKIVALETGFQLAGVIEKANTNSKKVILTNISY